MGELLFAIVCFFLLGLVCADVWWLVFAVFCFGWFLVVFRCVWCEVFLSSFLAVRCEFVLSCGYDVRDFRRLRHGKADCF